MEGAAVSFASQASVIAESVRRLDATEEQRTSRSRSRTRVPARRPTRLTLQVSGSCNEFESKRTHGTYIMGGQAYHRNYFFHKDEPPECFIYYYSDRHTSSWCGWWIGPILGSREVWACNPDVNVENPSLPPTLDWRVGPDPHGFVSFQSPVDVGLRRRAGVFGMFCKLQCHLQSNPHTSLEALMLGHWCEGKLFRTTRLNHGRP